ncbi:hypothetical protein AMTR_s00096p00044620 [Amborella trichopoda]|uniref:PX domain-containing protein n=2 Tax=Amborella trichopoda TaxID=13333 RepID=W1P5W0_AMBTC|nr:hypothetical protein AMTR_s00096p00044620 [Amborella trichopoda]
MDTLSPRTVHIESPDSSNYSSCGESELDRYCSANSLAGSFGTCNDFLGSETGSVKSFQGSFRLDRSLNHGYESEGSYHPRNTGEFDNSELGVTRSTGFEVQSSLGPELSEEMSRGYLDNDNTMGARSGSEEVSLGTGNDLNNSSNSHDDVAFEAVHTDASLGRNAEMGSFMDVSSQHGNGIDGSSTSRKKMGICVGSSTGTPSMSGNSSQCGSVEDLGSELDYGTDEENRVYAHATCSSFRQIKEKENPLLMNSAVAFGCDDWDEFELETGENGLKVLTLLTPETFQMQKEQAVAEQNPPEISNILCPGEDPMLQRFGCASTSDFKTLDPEEYNVRDISVASYEAQLNEESRPLKCSCVSNVHEENKEFMTFGHAKNLTSSHASYEAQLNGESCLLKYSSVSNNHEENKEFMIVGRAKILTSSPASNPSNSHSLNPHAELYATENAEEGLDSSSPPKVIMKIKDCVAERELRCITEEAISSVEIPEIEPLGTLLVAVDPLSDIIVASGDKLKGVDAGFQVSNPPLLWRDRPLDAWLKGMAEESVGIGKEDLVPDEAKSLEAFEFYDEMVHEMEDILLDSGDSHGARFPQGNRGLLPQRSQPCRDGSLTASASGNDDANPFLQSPLKIDWVEVVGARQQKGEVSFGERLVGVKEYTVYRLRVWSGKDQWEVERRYRDFYTLYRQLKSSFSGHGLSLPSPWLTVEQESRKIFGNASPDVVSERSTLIQACIRSILHIKAPFGTPPLIWFLAPPRMVYNSSTANGLSTVSEGKFSIPAHEEYIEGSPNLGKTISLIVEIQSRKSMKQLLEVQLYTCAGCYKHIDGGKSLLQDFVRTIGWGKPRLCEYTGQLFCTYCHTNDTAVLPARVLQLWDFSQLPVSQLAKAYLDSIYDQPMLCISAVNPFLFSKVPALLHVMGIRKKIGAMMGCVRCPFQRSIQRSLGYRRYLLEINEFFALRDLVDLSKGAFAVLPDLMETLSKRILDHITQQCLVCCDIGEPCGARLACEDPSSLIFPFQDSEVKRCRSCGLSFHESCLRRIAGCPCGALGDVGPAKLVSRGAREEMECGSFGLSMRKPESGKGFFSSLFSKAKHEGIWKSTRDNDPVILMGSLPSTSL